MISANTRFTVVVLLLTGTMIFQQNHARHEPGSSGKPLATFPMQVAGWGGTDVPLTPDVLKTLGKGDFLLRVYQDRAAVRPDVDLWVAYWPNQQAGIRRHVPQDCLTGSGWSIVESDTTTFSLPDRRSFQVNRYLISRGSERQLVAFWFWARGRRIASEDRADFYLVLDSLRLNRSDDALIRINTPLLPSENTEDAQQRLLAFLAQADPLFDQHIPR